MKYRFFYSKKAHGSIFNAKALAKLNNIKTDYIFYFVGQKICLFRRYISSWYVYNPHFILFFLLKKCKHILFIFVFKKMGS